MPSQKHPGYLALFLLVVGVLLNSCAHNKELTLINTYSQALSLARNSQYKRFAIIQGATSSDTTQVAILHHTDEKIEADLGNEVVGDQINWLSPSDRTNESFEGSDWQISQFLYRNLKSQGHYVLRVMSTSKDLVDMREISTINTIERHVKFGVVSCMDDAFLEQGASMWSELLSHQPQTIFFLGDTTYTDMRAGKKITVDPKTMWDRYVETRNAIPFFRNWQLIPVFATWDDHDFGVNDGDKSNPFKDEAKRIFNAFFPQKEISGYYERGEGVSGAFSAWNQQFVLMDGRSFRTGPSEPARNETHWGTKQEDWLFRKLRKDNTPTWIINGDQFFGKYHKFESYEGRHPQSFKKFLANLRRQKAKVVFLSGDRHLAELMEIKENEFGIKTYEITSSGIHSITYPDAWGKTPNPRKIEGASGTMNYAIIESEALPQSGLWFRVIAYGPDKRALFDRKFSVGK